MFTFSNIYYYGIKEKAKLASAVVIAFFVEKAILYCL